MLVFRAPGPVSNRKERKTNESKRIQLSLNVCFTVRAFVTGLVSAAVTEGTFPKAKQIVDVVEATVLYLNVEPVDATALKPVDADFSFDFTLSHCRMTTIQPDRIGCITMELRWTCGHHFCACSSLEAIPAIEVVVTFGVFCYVVMFSFCIGQILVILPVTYIN